MTFRIIELTQGNINNDHLYLSGVIEMFPPSSIGGPNEETTGAQLLEIHCGIEAPILTDIARDKKIFRKRSWVGEFFRSHHLNAGDFVVIEQTGPFRFHVYPVRGKP